MDASSPSAVRQPTLVQFPALEGVKQSRRAREALDQHEAKRRQRELTEAYRAGRVQGDVDRWLAGAKVGFVGGILFGMAIGGGLAAYFIKLGIQA